MSKTKKKVCPHSNCDDNGDCFKCGENAFANIEIAKREVYRIEDKKEGISMYTFLTPQTKNEKITKIYTLKSLLKCADKRGSREDFELSQTQLLSLLEELITL